MDNKVICVVGPTACGKTTLGVLLAKRLGGEVVSADSMQIYRGMSIGSAAPTPAEQGGVPHHMIGVADPSEQWSAARYVETAAPIVDRLLSDGKRPVIVGGSGLWIDALIRGVVFAPGHSGGAVRRELERRRDTEGIAPLLAELRAVDPDAAARLHPADEKRILRALEVYRETGQTITEHDRISRETPPRYDALWLGLRFRERADLWERINRRVDAMLEAGLLDEARALVDAVPPDATALQAIGYKELLPVLRGETPLAAAAEEIKLRTRQYAKRQLTWFRRNPAVHWMEWEKLQNFSSALQTSTAFATEFGVC